jgi:hypothetical protein
LIRYSRACGAYHDFLVRGKPMNQVYTEYLCHIYVPFVVNAIDTFSHSSLVTGFATRLTTRVPLVEQELLTLSEHMLNPCFFRNQGDHANHYSALAPSTNSIGSAPRIFIKNMEGMDPLRNIWRYKLIFVGLSLRMQN